MSGLAFSCHHAEAGQISATDGEISRPTFAPFRKSVYLCSDISPYNEKVQPPQHDSSMDLCHRRCAVFCCSRSGPHVDARRGAHPAFARRASLCEQPRGHPFGCHRRLTRSAVGSARTRSRCANTRGGGRSPQRQRPLSLCHDAGAQVWRGQPRNAHRFGGGFGHRRPLLPVPHRQRIGRNPARRPDTTNRRSHFSPSFASWTVGRGHAGRHERRGSCLSQ